MSELGPRGMPSDLPCPPCWPPQPLSPKANLGTLLWDSLSPITLKPCHLGLSPSCLSVDRACILSQLWLTLSDPMDCSPSGSSVHGILWARTLEWVAVPSSRGSSRPRDQTHVSYVSCIGRRVSLPTETLRKPSF